MRDLPEELKEERESLVAAIYEAFSGVPALAGFPGAKQTPLTSIALMKRFE